MKNYYPNKETVRKYLETIITIILLKMKANINKWESLKNMKKNIKGNNKWNKIIMIIMQFSNKNKTQ